jgi:hypothetical protein
MIFFIIGLYVGGAYWTLLASYYAPRTQGLFMVVMGFGSVIYGQIKYEEAVSRMEEEATVLIGSLFIA